MGAEGNSSRPLRVIVTGGIGSGKSTVVRMLAERGATVIETDRIGHQVLEPAGPAFAAVAERWPMVVRDGRIDRSLLAAVVFTDSDELVALEAITHPHIFGEVQRRVAAADDADIVVEMPVLVDFEGDDWVRIVVDAADETRLLRAVGRGMSRSDAAHRMASQESRDRWRAAADHIIRNTGSIEDLEQAVDALWRMLQSNPDAGSNPVV